MYFIETHTYSYGDRWRTFKRVWKMVHFLSSSLSNKQIIIFQAEVSDEGKEFLIFRHRLFCISISTTINARMRVVTVGDTNNFSSQSEDQRSQLSLSKQPHRNSWQVEVLAQPEHAQEYRDQLYCVWFICAVSSRKKISEHFPAWQERVLRCFSKSDKSKALRMTKILCGNIDKKNSNLK